MITSQLCSSTNDNTCYIVMQLSKEIKAGQLPPQYHVVLFKCSLLLFVEEQASRTVFEGTELFPKDLFVCDGEVKRERRNNREKTVTKL
jgi:hypothetical protein